MYIYFDIWIFDSFKQRVFKSITFAMSHEFVLVILEIKNYDKYFKNF